MTMKWIGAVLVVAGCGWAGFSAAAAHCREERSLRGLIRALRHMEWELSYRMTPLPELCRQGAREAGGAVGAVFSAFAALLENKTFPEVSACMRRAIRDNRDLPKSCCGYLMELGRSLGRYDLPGQLEGLRWVRGQCQLAQEELREGRGERLRTYQTLGLCLGAALVILFA